MSEKRFLLVYGSQTGQAQAISEEIRDRAVERGLVPEVHCLSQSEKKFHLEKEPVFVVVVSTTGDGDAPDTANKFWRRLKKRTLPSDHLAKCKYALLGLGDTNYSNFCNMGKMLNKRLLALGALAFYPPGFADDAVGLEIVVEPWIDGLWSPLEAVLSSSTSLNSTAHADREGSSNACAEGVSGPSSNYTTGEENQTMDHQATAADSRDIGSVDSGNKIKTTTLKQAVSNDSFLGQNRPSVGDTVEETLTVVGELAVPFQDKLSISPQPTGQSNTKTAVMDPVMMSSAQSSRMKTDQSTCSIVEKMAAIPSVEGESGLKQRISREETATKDELKTPSMELASIPLTLPSVPPLFIKVLLKNMFADSANVEFPFTKMQHALKTSVSMATIVKSRLLTQEGSVKKTMELEISLEDCPSFSHYQPGDAFGFVCPNPADEVSWLLQRLNLVSDCDKLMTLSILPDTAKRNPILPKHVPNPCSIAHFFTHCVDIRCVPKKAFLCYLSTCCSNYIEKRRLEELSSRQGAKDYSKLLLEQRSDFLDVLATFLSCQPQLPRLIELLPRLQPRYYSAASSPLVHCGRFKIAFNVEELPGRWWMKRDRLGLATGWFSSVAVPQLNSGQRVQVPIFPRVHNPFHLPDNPSTPVIMIGPGTGVSPFIGFLEHRQELYQRDLALGEIGRDRENVGKAWLFFGCRHPDKDYLYRSELESFLKCGVLTQLHVSFSRYSSDEQKVDAPRYVQDNVRLHWEELARWIMEEDASVFVCGDAKNMAKDINDALIEVLTRHLQDKPGSSEETGEIVLQKLKENCKYLVDAWG